MIGLALEGGGTRGSYQAGAYIALKECGIKIDGVCGTSIGALNGAFIASLKGSELPRIWRNSNIGALFGFSKEYVECVEAGKINLKYFKSSILNILNIIINKGIELDGLKKLLDQELNVDELMKSPIDFGLVTVRLKDLKPICLFKKDMEKNLIKDYIIASSFLPVFKMEKLIDDNYYIDGGFYDVSPVNMLLENGYKKVYLIKNYGIGIHRKYKEDADVIVIEPKRSLGNVLDIDAKRIEENIQMGYYDTLKVIKNLDGLDFVFKVKKESFYKRLNRKIPKYEYRRLKHFLNAKTEKETVIKALEYIMKKEHFTYYKIYNINKVIKKIKKLKKEENHFVYNYIRKLRLF